MTVTAPIDQVETDATFTIAEAGAATGTSTDTLRYYEKVGIMPHIGRTTAGHRAYSADDLGWITFIRRLRATGMPMQRIADYTAMVRQGEGTIADRRSIIEDHRSTVAAAIDELTTVLAVLDRKIQHYEAAELGVDVDCSETPLRHANKIS